MTWRNQIDLRTNAANVSTVWKYLKLSERDAKNITSTDSERPSPMRRGRAIVAWLLWWLKSQNGLKRLVNKLQNVMFSNTHTNYMYSNSCMSSRRQGSESKAREKFARHLLSNSFIYFLRHVTMWYVHQTSSQIHNENHLNICCCQQKEALRSSCGFLPK